ncbi:MAG: hypothetical protein JXR76_04800 [Deltaproteobacteria bacterium]|nr:hypothetical protein [Deltaproteobacteria bacterium]
MRKYSKRRIWVCCMTLLLMGVFAALGYKSILQQKASVLRDLVRDHETVGEMINLAAGRMDIASLKSFVEALDESSNRLSLSWIDLSNAPDEMRLNDVHVTIRNDANFAQEITTWHRVRNKKQDVLGILRVRELSHQSARPMTGAIVSSAFQAVLPIAGILIAFILGYSFVKKPDKKMVAKAKRALAGDFSGRIKASEKGTLADMAAAMDIMSEKIESIEADFRAEVASRLVIVEQLRHADRLKTVGQLTSGVLHELGTPLTIISGRAKMIEEGDVEGEEAVENAKIVVEQTGRISSMIRNILDFARKGKHTNQVADLNNVISRAILLLGPVALKHGVTLKWLPARSPMTVAAEVSQVQQVLANLILNAIQASGNSSEVIVSLTKETTRKPEGASPSPPAAESQYVVLSVIDFGEGIPKEHLENIFDSFFTTKQAGSGTGLGLAIAKQIAVEHGGWISVDSTPGKGSAFKVFLPRKEQ